MNADLIRSHLLERILPFWERHSIDREAGGFWTQLARDGSRVGAGRKMLVMQARMIYAFATAYRLTGEERYLEIASCGADFLRGRFRDTRHGGWFWAADRAGEPIDRSKRVYGQAFVAYALAGSMQVDLATQPLGTGSDGKPVYLRDIWPSAAEVAEFVLSQTR